jgi:hypothetical protein
MVLSTLLFPSGHQRAAYFTRVSSALFVAFLLCFSSNLSAENDSHSKNGKSDRKYIGKDYIDTSVQRAIYIINEAADLGGVGFKQKEAIVEAKNIAQRLKGEVKGDVNERYALWKVSELDWLIYLEEKDLVLQKVRQGQMTVQQCIADYNMEVGRPRPDFKTLMRLHSQMGELDARRANEMAGSIEKRSAVVSRESMVALEKALMSGAMAMAREEFKYCLRNRQYLALSSGKFAQLESRMSACERSRDELPLVKSESDSAQAMLATHRLGEARDAIAGAKCRLIDIRSCVPAQDAGECMTRLSQLERALGRQEDSLVRVNLDLLHARGVDAANQYLQAVLRKAGVCHEKTARVDQAILAVASPAEKSKVTKEIDAVAESADGGTDIFAEMRKKAKIKAQDRLDSIQIEKEERMRIAQAHLDSVDAEARKEAAQEFQKNQDVAKQSASEIYVLIEKNKAKAASDLFYAKQTSLYQYLPQEAFAMLETTVKQVNDLKGESGSGGIAYLVPATAAEQQPAASNTAAKSPEKKGDANREKAAAIIAKVYDMLERNDVRGASRQFDREKSFLKNSLDKETYDMLSTTISQAIRK